MKYVLFPEDLSHDEQAARERVGGKAAALGALGAASMPIPAWFALTPQACWDSLSEAQRTSLTNGGDPDVLADLYPSPDVLGELERALERLGGGEEIRLAVRSSAVEEDGARHAFAGQLRSFLGVPLLDVRAKVAAVWRSAFGPDVRAYRRAHGLGRPGGPPAVLVQRMVRAGQSGVAFSADPATGQRGVAVVSAALGLGSALVDGAADADVYRVDRAGVVIEKQVAVQEIAHEADVDGGTRTVHLPNDTGSGQKLAEADVRAVAALARRAERAFGRPQDVEWAIADGRLWLLQSRPVTALNARPDPDGQLRLWDNSNIAESYGGVTGPLTFSFARKAYRHVYRAFCRLVGVRETVIRDHADAFDGMIGLVRGRAYYNLASWYRVLALLPGYRFNRRFMEGMMGVRDGLPDELFPDVRPASRRERAADFFHLLRTAFGLVRTYRRLPIQTKDFYRRLDVALTPPAPGLDRLRLDELAGYYRRLEGALLTRWDAPIVNDFFAMLFFGLSKKLVERWGPPDAPGLHNRLLCGEGGIVSAEPARRLREMAENGERRRGVRRPASFGELGRDQAGDGRTSGVCRACTKPTSTASATAVWTSSSSKAPPSATVRSPSSAPSVPWLNGSAASRCRRRARRNGHFARRPRRS